MNNDQIALLSEAAAFISNNPSCSMELLADALCVSYEEATSIARILINSGKIKFITGG